MKKRFIFLILGLFVLFGHAIESKAYLWEMLDDMGNSCCLHMDGVDICNPYVPCTHYMEADLLGIAQYINRLLTTDRGNLEPYRTLLIQVKRFIRTVLQDSYYVMTYQLDQYRSVQFYHELIDSASKGKDKSNSVSKLPAQKQSSKQDYVRERLIRLGLYHTHKKDKVL